MKKKKKKGRKTFLYRYYFMYTTNIYNETSYFLFDHGTVPKPHCTDGLEIRIVDIDIVIIRHL